MLERHYDPDLSLKASKRKTETETDLSSLLEATSTDVGTFLKWCSILLTKQASNKSLNVIEIF